jgi:DNA (cytosine-5)-methyltransferase 1
MPLAFSCKVHGADASALSPTLRAMGHDGSHANAGGQVAIAFAQNSRDEVRIIGGDGAVVGALAAEPGAKQQSYVAFAQNQLGEVRTSDLIGTLNTNSNASGRATPMVATNWAVRRLTPRECERLQGFPDDYTAIPWRGKPAEQCPDGPRYKALGNSIAVPELAWIGKRIMLCESVAVDLAEAA